MIVTLYCYNFNNYYNRVLKKKDTLQDYGDYIHSETGVNFNFSDGVNTSQVINTESNPDYVLVIDEQGNINSRWFIIDATYTRNGQHVFQLHRDVLADYWDNILVADTFIEKAVLNDTNPLIYNQEAITTNQIKQSETLLKDKTNSAWIVGYYARESEGTVTALSGNVTPNITPDKTVAGIENWDYYEYTAQGGSSKFYGNATNEELKVYTYRSTLFNHYIDYYTLTNSSADHNYYNILSQEPNKPGYRKGSGTPLNADILDKLNEERDNLWAYVHAEDTQNATKADTDKFVTETNLNIIFDSTNARFYRVTVNKTYTNYSQEIKNPDSGFVQYVLTDVLNAVEPDEYDVLGAGSNIKYLDIKKSYYTYSITLEDITADNATYSYSITATRNHLVDAPYDMFAIPYNDIVVTNGGSSVTCNGSLGLLIANQMNIKYGVGDGAFIYDIQLLPYCPLPQEMVNDDGSITVTDSKSYSTIKDASDNIKGYIFNCSTSNFDLEIPVTLALNNVKMQNQTEMYRLCSPNFNGQFEFNLARNGGCDKILVDCTYKPYNPYIKLSPNFNKLYGRDYDDARGLICGGEFGIPLLSSSWTTYQRNNANYQNIFDREIQNLEINNKYALLQQGVNAGVGTVSGIVGGATAGGMVGHGIGAGIVAAVGGIASLAGGIADTQIMKNLQNEAMDYKKDLFGMQLDNIRAMPYSLTRTSAFTKNNKIWPLLEKYDCTDEEKKVVAKKIAWNGMTVGAIGKIEEYITNTWSYDDIEDKGYIKGQLIRVDGINEDMHLVNTIADEINKGVYTKWVYNQA